MKLIITVILNFIFILSCQIAHAAYQSTSVTINKDQETAVLTLFSSDLKKRTTAVRCKNITTNVSFSCNFESTSKLSSMVEIEQSGLYEITFFEFNDGFLGFGVSVKEIWKQQIYVPTKPESGHKELAEKYMPVIVFNKDEEYFPVSLDTILSFGSDVNQKLYFKETLIGGQKINMGQPVKEYMAFNGHSESLIDVNTVDPINNPAICNADIPIVCRPHFLRGLFGNPKKPVVYWEVSRELGKVYLTYHFFYGFDPKIGSSVAPAPAAHILDRESFTIVLNQSMRPERVIYPGHLDTQVMSFTGSVAEPKNEDNRISWNGGKTSVPWDTALKAGDNPVIYKARGSHAIFPAQGFYRVQQKQDQRSLDLVEEAGSMQNAKVVLPEQLDLRELDLTSSELKPLAFSGYWVDVIGGVFKSNARFTPFTGRAPYAPWSETARFDFANPKAEFEQTSCFDSPDCKNYFDYLYGLNDHGAVQVVVEDPGMSVNLLRTAGPVNFDKSIEYTVDEPKTVFYEAGLGSLSVVANYPQEPRFVCIENLKSMLNSDVMFNAAPAVEARENQIPIVTCGRDTDGDGERNSQDLDDDNDGFSDEAELASGSDPLDLNDRPKLPVLKANPSERESGKLVVLTLEGGDATKFSKVVWSAAAQTKQATAPDAFADQIFVMAEQDMTVTAKFYGLNGDLVYSQSVVVTALKVTEPTEPLPTTLKLNDTGVTLCGDYAFGNSESHSNSESCGSSSDLDGDPIPYGQDGHYGTGKDGSLGMSFTKASGFEGKCVFDNHTGLMWEVKQGGDGVRGNQGLHDADDTYNWFTANTINDGGLAGLEDSRGATCSGYNAGNSASFCNTRAFVKRVNAESWCGHSDWRLPTREELRNTVHYGELSPSVNIAYFPNTVSSFYWSSSPVAYNSELAWSVYFGRGYDSAYQKNSSNYVRLVRAR